VNGHFRAAFTLAHLARCAAAIFARDFAEIFCPFDWACPPNARIEYTPPRELDGLI